MAAPYKWIPQKTHGTTFAVVNRTASQALYFSHVMTIYQASVGQMIERAIELARRYAVWWRLLDKATSASDDSVLNDHENFFATTSQALFESFVVITAQIYERRRDAISLPVLVDQIAASHRDVRVMLRSILAIQRPILVKVFQIQSGLSGHRSRHAFSAESTVGSSGLSNSEMITIIEMTNEIVGSLAEVAGLGSKTAIMERIERRRTCAQDDTSLLMAALKECSNSV